MKVTARISIALALALFGGPCLAGEPRPVEPAPRFGTTNDATYKVSAFDYSPIDSTTQYVHDQQGGDYTLLTTTPYGAFYAWPDLPAGGLLETMSVYACNLNPPGGDDFLVLLENTDPSGNFLGVLGTRRSAVRPERRKPGNDQHEPRHGAGVAVLALLVHGRLFRRR